MPFDLQYRYQINASFYSKVSYAYDLPVIASENVHDIALMKACKLVLFLLSDRPDIISRLAYRGAKFGIVGMYEMITEIPEYSHLPSWYNQRARGIGGTRQHTLTVSSEENLLCSVFDMYKEDIYVHEVAHGIHLIGGNRPFSIDSEIKMKILKFKRLFE